MFKSTYEKIYYRLLPKARLSSYELELLAGDDIPQALPLRFLQKDGERFIELALPTPSESLLSHDQKLAQSQGLGLSRALNLLSGFLDAKARLLDPSFTYLNLELLAFDGKNLRFPLLPVKAGEAVRLPDDKIYPDFWYEWAGFYGVQKELAELARQLSAQGELEALREVFEKYLKQEQKFLKEGLHQHWKAAWSLNDPLAETNPLPMGAAESTLAELLPLQRGRYRQKRKRLALLAADEFVLGRDSAFSDLSFKDPWMGRKHARILKARGHFYFEDLASLNGSFVDGRRLLKNERLLLPDNCVLRLGRTQIEFRRLEHYPPTTYFVPNNLSPASPKPGTM